MMSAPALRVDDLERGRPDGSSATRAAVRLLGALAALAGAEHGVGELTQPDPDSGALAIESWPHVAAFEPLGGEPAMTLLPDLRVAGVITVLVSVGLGWWAVRTRVTRRDGWGFLGLSTLLLLVGGGFGPPLMGVVLGVALLRPVPADARVRPPGVVRTAVAPRWPQLLVLTVAAFLALVPGVPLLTLAGIETVWLTATLPVIAFAGLVLTLVAVRTRDRVMAQQPTER